MPYFKQNKGQQLTLWLMLSLILNLSAILSNAAQAQGLLPSLDNDTLPSGGITPIAELTGAPLIEQHAAVEPTPLPVDNAMRPIPGYGTPMLPVEAKPLAPQATLEPQPEPKSEPQPTKKAETAAKPETKPESKPKASKAEKTKLSAPAKTEAEAAKPETETDLEKKKTERPVTDTSPAASAEPRKALKFSLDFSQAVQNARNLLQTDEKAIQPVSYTPLPGIAVFAVVKHGNDRAFGDLPVLFAREYAQHLGVKAPNTKIYHPIYTVDELRLQGLGHVYDQIMSYYIKTGAPEPAAMDYLLKQLSNNRPTISRVVFVEADVDFSHPDASSDLLDKAKQLMTDGTPKQMRYFVNSRLQIFDAEKSTFPIVWGGSWRRSVKTDQFYNVTPSVYADSDSQQAFARVSRLMSQEMLYITPKEVYMAPQYDTALQGKIVSGKQTALPNLSDDPSTSNGLTVENKQAIQRVLQRQNNISP